MLKSKANQLKPTKSAPGKKDRPPPPSAATAKIKLQRPPPPSPEVAKKTMMPNAGDMLPGRTKLKSTPKPKLAPEPAMGGVQDATKEKSATNAAGKQDREINDPPKSTEQLQTENEELRKSLNQKDRQLETAKGQMEEVQKAKESLSYEITNLKKKVKRMVDETKKKDDKISSLRGKIDQLSNGSKAEGGQKAGSKRKNADDSEDDDDGWDTGTPERRSSPVSAPVDHGELRKKLARVEQERDEAVKKLKLIKVSPGKGKSTATSSPGGGDEAKKEMYLNLLEAELREAKSDKEKALKFVIDMVGKKRFQSFLQEAQDLKSLKKIVRKKISGGGAMGATSSSGVRDISPVKAHLAYFPPPQ